MKGIYILLIELDRPEVIRIGNTRNIELQEGFYGYVGSALSGLERRLGRHLSSRKRLHWHIDHLLTTARVRKIICAETSKRKECTSAQMLSQRLPGIAGFGCSDCKCRSHLFYCQNLYTLDTTVFDALNNLGLNPFVFE